MSDEEIKRSIEAVQSLLQPLQKGEFSEKLYKVSVYLQSIRRAGMHAALPCRLRRKRMIPRSATRPRMPGSRALRLP